MKKEKKVRTYQRRTKSGKTVTVRAHTASYEAAEKAKEAAKKKGAGEELSSKVKKGEEWKLPMDEFLKKLKDDRDEKKWNDEVLKSWKSDDEKSKKKSKKKTEKTLSENTIKKRTVGTGTNGPELKKKTTTKKMVAKADTSEPAFTRDEFKEWYRGTGSAADKKVAKALRKQLGRSGYNKFEDEAISNYTSRGHLSMFKRVSGGSSTSAKTKSTDSTKVTKDKVSTPKKEAISEQSLNSKGFKTFKMPQIGTLYLGKAGKGAYIKFKGKKNIQKADIDDYEDFITGHDGLTKAQKKQLSSLGYTEHEEYTSRSQSNLGGTKRKKDSTSVAKPTKSTGVTISKVPKSDRNKIISYVERATDGEYSSGKYTWKDTLAALRHPSESTVRERVERMYGVKVDGLKRDDGSKKRSVGTGTNGPEPKVKNGLSLSRSKKTKSSDLSTHEGQMSYIRSRVKELPDESRKKLNTFLRKASTGVISTTDLWRKYQREKYPKNKKQWSMPVPWDKRAMSDMTHSD